MASCWISAGNHAASGWQRAQNTALCYWYSLLLHSFKQSVLIACHFVELVDAADAEVTQNKRTSLEVLFVRKLIPDKSRCQASVGGWVTTNIDASRRYVDNVFQHLRLTKTWFTNHQNMDVWSYRRHYLSFISLFFFVHRSLASIFFS